MVIASLCVMRIERGGPRSSASARSRGGDVLNHIYAPASHPGRVKEPSSWFREESSRTATDLETLNVGLFSKGKVKVYRCTLLDQECRYVADSGAGDCRRCNFALAYMMANPQYVKEIIDRK